MDFYRLLRTGGPEESVPMTEAYTRVDRVLGSLRKLAGESRLRLDEVLKRQDTGAIVGDALAHLKSYHRRPALVRRGDRLFHEDRNLLLYYHNRLTGFGLPTWEKPQ
jgi:glycerol-3-phosphate O-acyltransferase